MDELHRLAIEAALKTVTSPEYEAHENIQLARLLLREAGLPEWKEEPAPAE